MIIGKQYIIKRNYGWSPVTFSNEIYSVESCKTREEAELKIKEYKRKDNKKCSYYIEESIKEASPYGDWRDVYG